MPLADLSRFRLPGKLYKDELYMLGQGKDGEVYNFRTNQWRPMSVEAIPINPGNGPCMVVWRDALIVFGGSDAPMAVQEFNMTSQVNPQFMVLRLISERHKFN